MYSLIRNSKDTQKTAATSMIMVKSTYSEILNLLGLAGLFIYLHAVGCEAASAQDIRNLASSLICKKRDWDAFIKDPENAYKLPMTCLICLDDLEHSGSYKKYDPLAICMCERNHPYHFSCMVEYFTKMNTVDCLICKQPCAPKPEQLYWDSVATALRYYKVAPPSRERRDALRKSRKHIQEFELASILRLFGEIGVASKESQFKIFVDAILPDMSSKDFSLYNAILLQVVAFNVYSQAEKDNQMDLLTAEDELAGHALNTILKAPDAAHLIEGLAMNGVKKEHFKQATNIVVRMILARSN